MKIKHLLPVLAVLLGYFLLALATYYAPQRAEERRYELEHPHLVLHRSLPVVPVIQQEKKREGQAEGAERSASGAE